MISIKTETQVKSNWKSIGILSIAHIINDIYGNFIPQLIPFLIAANILSISTGATLVGAFTITSSISQPIFGYLVDQKDQRWLIFVGTMWMSILLGMTGFTNNYLILLVLAGAAGLGTAAFHPQAAAMIGQSRVVVKVLF